MVFVIGCGPSALELRPAGESAVRRADSGEASSCAIHLRKISAPGLGGVHAGVAASPAGYAVVWEETEESHRGIHFQALDAHATPLGPSVEVADLSRGGAEPQV